MKERNISLDLLKFIAVILIINSHADICYPHYKFLASGGSIGDVLFLFCSGFTIFMGRIDRFDNWYKRRINRIYPSVFAFLLYVSVVLNEPLHANSLIFRGGWFIYCIMIYYVILYLIRRYMNKHLNRAFVIVSTIILIWYLFEDKDTVFMYHTTYDFPKGFYFLFMLFGAMIGVSERKFKFNLVNDGLKLGGSIIFYYAFLFLCNKVTLACQFQILSLIPLMGITFYFYKICNADMLLSLVKTTKIIGWIIALISSLTLEIYMIQFSLITDRWNELFPLNLLIIFVLITFIAYILKTTSRIFSQTFSENRYDWRAIFLNIG